MTVSIDEQFSWLVSVLNTMDSRWSGFDNNSPTALRHIKKTFTVLGFSILELPNAYYNPTVKRFIIKHSKASAITLWNLQHTNLLKRGVSIESQFNV